MICPKCNNKFGVITTIWQSIKEWRLNKCPNCGSKDYDIVFGNTYNKQCRKCRKYYSEIK